MILTLLHIICSFITAPARCAIRRIRALVRGGIAAAIPGVIAMGMVVASATAQTILRVDINSTAPIPDGQSWSTAYPYLQDALNAVVNPTPQNAYEIWVAAGTYTPDLGSGYTQFNSAHSFSLRNNVAILGGFSGDGWETERSSRDWITNVTILSGDLNDDDDFYEDDGFQYDNYEDNSSHVVKATNVGPSAVLDGFTVRGGNAGGGGGGYLGDGASPIIRNVIFRENITVGIGPGFLTGGAAAHIISNASGAPVLFQHCLFTHNMARRGNGTDGVDRQSGGAKVVFIGCEFKVNVLSNSEGAAACSTHAGDVTFVNCTFAGDASQK
jgi:hypothetical protein